MGEGAKNLFFFCEKMDLEGLGVSVDLGTLPNVLSQLSTRITFLENNQKDLAASVGMSD